MEEFNSQVVGRLPLAEAVLQTFAYLAEESFLANVYEKYRGRSYESTLSFADLVRVMSEALLEHGGSAHRALRQAQADEQLDASLAAWYGKLRRTPEFLSQGFLVAGTQRLQRLLPTTTSSVPESLRMFDVRAIDGKKLKHAAKRLKPTRLFGGSVLGGQSPSRPRPELAAGCRHEFARRRRNQRLSFGARIAGTVARIGG